MKVYLSGPMSSLPEHNYPAFHAAAQWLRTHGYEVLNPAESFGGDRTLTRRQYLLTALWSDKLKPGETLNGEDVAMMHILDKLSRARKGYKRDHLVDCVGYVECWQWTHEHRVAEEAKRPPQ